MSQIVDALVREGCARIDSGLKERIADWVEAQRLPDGGYPGRAGGSDPYYTDFALRLLSFVRPASIGLSSGVVFEGLPVDVPECFNRASIALNCSLDPPAEIEPVLASFRLDSGAYSRHAGSSEPSAYATFLGALCEDALGLFHEPSTVAFEQILALQQADGGFIDTPSVGISQANATAAAVGYLLRGSHVEPIRRAVNYLKGLQVGVSSDSLQAKLPASDDIAGSADVSSAKKLGGFLAHAQADYPDLLTTFTALAILSLTDSMKGVDLKAQARFVGSLATREGGFRSCFPDPEPDIEYTYYGLGSLALIWLNV